MHRVPSLITPGIFLCRMVSPWTWDSLPTLLETSKPQQVTSWCHEARLALWVLGFELSILVNTEQVHLAVVRLSSPVFQFSRLFLGVCIWKVRLMSDPLVLFISNFSLSFSKASI